MTGKELHKMKKVPIRYRVLLRLFGYPAYVVLTVFRLPNFIIRRRLRENRIHNCQTVLSFPLNGQGVGTLSTFRIGTKQFAQSGCGAIAVFNALSIIGREPDLSEIIDFLERKGLVCYGKFGINPVAIGKYLNRENVNWKRYGGVDLPEHLYERGDSVIALYGWASHSGCGNHYVALERLEDGWKAYNVYNNAEKAIVYPDLKTFMEQSPYCRPIAWFLLKKTPCLNAAKINS